MGKVESLPGCSFFNMKSSESCREEHDADAPVTFSCWDDSAYFVCCMPLSDHHLYSNVSVIIISDIRACLRKIRSLTLIPTYLPVSVLGLRDLRPFWGVDPRMLWTSRWGCRNILDGVKIYSVVIAPSYLCTEWRARLTIKITPNLEHCIVVLVVLINYSSTRCLNCNILTLIHLQTRNFWKSYGVHANLLIQAVKSNVEVLSVFQISFLSKLTPCGLPPHILPLSSLISMHSDNV